MERCGDCRIALAFLATAIFLLTGGAGLPTLGASVARYAVNLHLGVSANAATTALGCMAGLSLALVLDWICCNILQVKSCCG